MSVDINHLTSSDVPLMEALLTMFGEAFDDMDTYAGNRPSESYLRQLLGNDTFLALVDVTIIMTRNAGNLASLHTDGYQACLGQFEFWLRGFVDQPTAGPSSW